ncbi:hypothetical protein PHYPSEUDO_014882 [Phytophthora pseudosyringae]|uniref:Uncharacterized protein n=1 Tax=Phytophthora pseudosyringae TaxID=221518 RepID=A0A8T1W1A1_9STRA|nr:hypothetical protein PHYPSEUDO_014882 [Phytophthora pseudosyringae]
MANEWYLVFSDFEVVVSYDLGILQLSLTVEAPRRKDPKRTLRPRSLQDMGQTCSNVMARCCPARRHPSVQHRENKEPLVVEDESWKRWSSYNLIHHPSASTLQDYAPPTYVGPTQQAAVAVWEV